MTDRLYMSAWKIRIRFYLALVWFGCAKKMLKIVDKFHVDGVDKLIENQPERMQSCQKLTYIHRYTFFFWYKV